MILFISWDSESHEATISNDGVMEVFFKGISEKVKKVSFAFLNFTSDGYFYPSCLVMQPF